MTGDPPRMLLHYEVLTTLGTGMMGKVKLGVDTKTKQCVALKLIDWQDVHDVPKLMKNIAREINAMRRVHHPNVLQLIEYHEQVVYETSHGRKKTVILLVVELAKGGELMDFLMHTGAFPEDIARTYFQQLIAGLEACHAHGVYHRDIKPENLLFDADFSLKIADFGLAALNENAEESAAMDLRTSCGTRPYMSPEVVRKVPYEGAPADVWSAGVVLFIMLSGAPPFGVADDNDWWYRACASRRYDLFWAAHEQTTTFSEGAKALLTRIFAVDPQQRLTIAEIKADPWFQGETVPVEGLREELLRRKEMVGLNKRLSEAQVLSVEDATREFDPQSEVKRSLREMSSDVSSCCEPPKYPDEMVPCCSCFRSRQDPSVIQSRIEMALDRLPVEYEVNKDRFKTKVQGKEDDVAFATRVYCVDSENCFLVECRRTRGDCFRFRRLFDAMNVALTDLHYNAEDDEDELSDSTMLI